MSTTSIDGSEREPRFRLSGAWLTLFVFASIGLRLGHVNAQVAPVVLVPVVTDRADAPRLLDLARLLRAAMADRDVPTVAARYTATIEEAKATGDAFAAALDLSGEFATLRYDFYSDELVRAHTLRLMELAKAHTAILLAAPMANRIVLKRISRADGQSVALPDPCAPELVHQALAELLPPAAPPSTAPEPERAALTPYTRKWLLVGSASLGASAATVAVALSAKRRTLGTQLENSAPSDADYLSLQDAWRSRRPAMLATASVASASLSLAGTLFATHYDSRRLRWFSIPAATIGAATLAWAASDIARGAPCPSDAGTTCVNAESQLDRGILLALLSAPALAIATTHLGRWIHARIQVGVDASAGRAALSVAYRR